MVKYGFHVGKYTNRPMDPMGLFQMLASEAAAGRLSLKKKNP